MASSESIVSRADAFASLPAESNLDALADIRKLLPTSPALVVLDDDPTGTQTCHNISVLTSWEVDELVTELSDVTQAGFFVLTNSRAFEPTVARKLISGICMNVKKASEMTKREVRIILRGDSTLRGHFPLEPEACEEGLGVVHDGWILCPFFLQGNRFTLNDVHYLGKEDSLIPVAQTEFAKDESFGYQHSNLKEYVEEKTRGSIEASDVGSVSINDIRQGGPEKVAEILGSVPKHGICIWNAATEHDVQVCVFGLMQCEKETGKRFLYRTAATFVSSRLAMDSKPPMGPKEFGSGVEASHNGGLIIVGSYVPTTSTQVENLLKDNLDLEVIKLDVSVIATLEYGSAKLREIIEAAARDARASIICGRDTLIMTSRELVSGSDAVASLAIGEKVSKVVVDIVKLIGERPKFLIAKGGITSSDLATKALGMKKALVVGQAAPGIPLWKADAASLWPELPYIVFPGNTGGPETLRVVADAWKGSPAPRMMFSKGR
jgi:uncharacterized protein YgbK (DUF1537 family)